MISTSLGLVVEKSLYLGWLIGFFGQTEFALHESRDSEFYSSKTMARLGIERTLGMRDVENNPRDYGIARDKARDKKIVHSFFRNMVENLKVICF